MATQTDMSPGDDYFAITPSDTNDLTIPARSLIVATGGTLKVKKPNGNDETMTVPAGVLPIKVRRVYATGTAASGFTGIV